ncbi:hypothetical protein [uncultured Piscinibacter sp.]|nr:hypothetical protein [uncultured Piscinibacter sp.]
MDRKLVVQLATCGFTQVGLSVVHCGGHNGNIEFAHHGRTIVS